MQIRQNQLNSNGLFWMRSTGLNGTSSTGLYWTSSSGHPGQLNWTFSAPVQMVFAGPILLDFSDRLVQLNLIVLGQLDYPGPCSSIEFYGDQFSRT